MTTNYETAPSTLLLASHCARCGRKLADADSVETGIGPICAEKWGVAQGPSTPAEWEAIADAVRALHTEGFAMTINVEEMLTEKDAKTTAQVLTHKLALMISHTVRTTRRDIAKGHFVKAIAACGYPLMASAAEKGTVTEEKKERRATLRLEYTKNERGEVVAHIRCENLTDELFQAYRWAMKHTRGARYLPAFKCWEVVSYDGVKREIVRAVKAQLPYGSEIDLASDKGTLTVQGPSREVQPVSAPVMEDAWYGKPRTDYMARN
jgi:hypothetical protein